ncbi:MAG TPA: tetratricopeptide repeat protein [Anaerolineales bacterium]
MADTLMGHGQHGAEVLAWMMRQVFDVLTNQILSQGGTITGFAGDSVTALFRDDDDPRSGMRRALAAAWGFQQALARQPNINTIYGSFPITAKAGLAHGTATWGIVMSRDKKRASYYFSGEPVNGSAEAEHQAHSGEIILPQDIYQELADEINCSPMVPYYLVKGIQKAPPEPRTVVLDALDLETMHAFFPDILLKTNVPLEFRQVVNLFIQLSDPSAEALEEFMEGLFEIQMHYGGLISRIDQGDKGCNLLLFWGAPLAFENDIPRALHFVSDLRAQCKGEFKAGMTYYVSCAGFMGSDQREEYTCYGRGVNLAARFMTEASFGETWLDVRIASRAQNQFELEDIGERNFKGFAQKERVFKLHRSKTSATISYQREMVGREDELRRLAGFVSPIWEGNFAGGLVILGEAGMGKSRLASEFRDSRLFKDHPTTWALCQTNQLLRKSLDPFRYWLSQYFDLTSTQDQTENLRRFHEKLQVIIDSTSDVEIQSELNRTKSFLAALVGLHWENSLFEQLDAQGRYDNTFIALSILIKAECLTQPLVIFIEDAQDIDEDSIAFLSYLNRSLRAENRNYPLAMIATARKESSITLDKSIFEYEIELGTISHATLQRLAETILGAGIAASLQQVLDERAEGNPFFVEQILGYLKAENLLRRGQNGWELSTSGQDFALPVDIHALLVARLDQLTREARDVIQTASILGREFEVLVLSHILGNNTNLRIGLVEAERAAIWSTLNEIHYIFHHGLLRDAAYTMQMQARREQLHGLAVEALETVFREQIQSHYPELGFHAERANLVEKARQYLKLAGDTSREVFQNTLAADYYSRALALTPEEDHRSRLILLLNRERAYAFQGQVDEQVQDLSELRKLAVGVEIELQAEVALREIKFQFFSGNSSGVIKTIRPALKLARASGKTEIELQAYIHWAFSLYRQGKFLEAIRKNQKGLSLARKVNDQTSEAKLLNSLGLVYLELKEFNKARTLFETSLKIADEVHSLSIKARILNNLAMLAGFFSDFNSAQAYYEQSLKLSREIGDRKGEGIVLINLGWYNGVMGNYTKAREYILLTLRISRETGDRFNEAYSLINLSSQTGASGEYEAALDYARQSLEIAQSIGDQSGEAWAWTYLGHNLMATGQLGEAVEAYTSALSLRQQLNQPVMATEPAAGLARTNLLLGEIELANTQIESTLAHIDGGGNFEGTDEPVRVYLNCYHVLQAAGNPRSKEILNIGYRALQKRIENIQGEEAKTAFVENIIYNREILSAWQQNFSK